MLPSRITQQVDRIAEKKRLSDNRVLVELVEQGLEAQKEKEKRFSHWLSVFGPHPTPRKSSTSEMKWDGLSSENNAEPE